MGFAESVGKYLPPAKKHAFKITKANNIKIL